jgi:hypothetical protein
MFSLFNGGEAPITFDLGLSADIRILDADSGWLYCLPDPEDPLGQGAVLSLARGLGGVHVRPVQRLSSIYHGRVFGGDNAWLDNSEGVNDGFGASWKNRTLESIMTVELTVVFSTVGTELCPVKPYGGDRVVGEDPDSNPSCPAPLAKDVLSSSDNYSFGVLYQLNSIADGGFTAMLDVDGVQNTSRPIRSAHDQPGHEAQVGRCHLLP